MIVYVQWSLKDPTDWVSIDLQPTGRFARAWQNLPKKPTPGANPSIDDTPGWIYAVNIQGVIIEGFDHYSAEPLASGGLRAYGWTAPGDDAQTFGEAVVWRFEAPAPDARLGGGVNTLQYLDVYSDDLGWLAQWDNAQTTGGPVVQHPWSEFPTPPAQVTFDGVWVPNPDQHEAVRARHGWPEWVGA